MKMIPDLKRHFQSQPANERKPANSTVELPCLPPEGKPNPRVFWLKNGDEIVSRQDPNVIIANDGSLLIAAARLSDAGNYTCGAENLANRRLTEPVQLQVYGKTTYVSFYYDVLLVWTLF